MTDTDPSQLAELALRASDGDRRAFTELMERTKRPLYRLARRYVGSDEDAHDILQEAYVAAWWALKRYDGRRSLLTWLRTITLNKCRDHRRRQAVRAKFRTLFSFVSPDREEAPDPFGNEDEVRLHRLDVAIAGLPSFYKEPLILTAINGLSHKEAAAELKTSSKAIEMRLRRARQKLQEVLSDKPGTV